MRKTLLVGLVLVIAAVMVVLASAAFDLELEPVALLGVAVGAVVALVPDRTPFMRLAGFAGGFVAAWVGYLLRASALPDSAGGRSVAIAVVVLLAVAVSTATLGRVPLWSTLLGAAALAGAYEQTYAAAPPEVASTSVSTATILLFTAAVGFLATALVAPGVEQPLERTHRAGRRADDETAVRLDDLMMEKIK